jgi:hypothetical protein
MAYRIKYKQSLEDKLIEAYLKLNSSQQTKFKNAFNSISSNPSIGHSESPLPIAINTDYWIQQDLGENAYLIICYDIEKSNNESIINIRAFHISELSIKDM